MKKLLAMTMVLSLSAFLLAGCAKEAAEQESAAETDTAETESAAEESQPAAEQKSYPREAYLDGLDVDEFVEPGEYIGVEVSVEAPYVSDSQVDSAVQSALNSHPKRTEITNRAAADGDLTDISYVGKKDGVAFDGGTADNYELELGSDSFIDGFEDGIIGMKTGETKDLNLTFPEGYGNADLAGADVVFTVTLNKIYELSDAEFNDEFVAGLSIDGVTTTEEYRQYLYDNYMQSAQSQYEADVQDAVMDAVFSGATFKKDAEDLADRYFDRVVNNNYAYLNSMAMMYGVNLEDILGMSWDEYVTQNEESIRESANVASRQILLLQAIAEREGLTVSSEEISSNLMAQAIQNGYSSGEDYVNALGEDIKSYGEILIMNKVMDFLVENAVVTQTEPETEEASAGETASEETSGAEEETAAEEFASDEETASDESAAETVSAEETATEEE